VLTSDLCQKPPPDLIQFCKNDMPRPTQESREEPGSPIGKTVREFKGFSKGRRGYKRREDPARPRQVNTKNTPNVCRRMSLLCRGATAERPT
jgi:hypothetical protein